MPLSLKNTPALIISTLLLVISLPRGGNIEGVSIALSLMLSSALLAYTLSTGSSNKYAVYKSWFIVWLGFTLWCLTQYFIVPHFVSWYELPQEIAGIDLAGAPVYSDGAIESLMRFSSYWCLAFLVSRLKPSDIAFCLRIILCITLFQAIYGLASHFNNHQLILGVWEKVHYQSSATGTFINHNHYANFLALATPLSVAWILKKPLRSHSVKIKTIRLFLAIGLSGICAIAMLESLSRMGLAVGLLGILCILATTTIKLFADKAYLQIPIFLATVAVIGVLLLAVGIGDISDRYIRVIIYDMRWEIWEATLNLPTSLWLLGSGIGSFTDVFWPIHPPNTPKTAYYAHNDYLQFIIEFGVIGTVIMFSTLLYWFKQNYSSSTSSLLKTASIISICIMGLHSLTDFSLHIPANAIMFWFCVGIIVNPNLNKRRTKKRLQRKIL